MKGTNESRGDVISQHRSFQYFSRHATLPLLDFQGPWPRKDGRHFRPEETSFPFPLIQSLRPKGLDTGADTRVTVRP